MKQPVSFRQKALAVAATCAYIAGFIAVGGVSASLRRADAFAEKARETYKRRMATRTRATLRMKR